MNALVVAYHAVQRLLCMQAFVWRDGAPPVGEFGLQSFWFELGERSYMREPLALAALAAAGVPAPASFHVKVFRNGRFFGLFSFVEVRGLVDGRMQPQQLKCGGRVKAWLPLHTTVELHHIA